MIVDVYIGNFKLDMFKDEGIELNSSVANINDISKNTTEYTKSFTVPASHINNKIFKHYYNANIDNTFDARVKVAGRIELSGIPFKTGKWRLEKVNVKQRKPSSYTINFRGDLVSLKDKFKDDELSVLDLLDFDHDYTSANVSQGLTSSLFSGDVIYNLFAKKQYYYKNLSSDNVNTTSLANIAWGGGANVGVSWTDLKPSLKVFRIIEAIEAKYNITFTRDFFGRTQFTDLYLWLNSNATDSIAGDTKKVNFNGGSSTFVNFTTDIGTFDTFRNSGSTAYRNYQLILTITPDTGFENVEYTVKTFRKNTVNGSLVYDFTEVVRETATGTTQLQSLLLNTVFPNQEDQIYYEISTQEAFSYNVNLRQIQRQKFTFNPAPIISTVDTTGDDVLAGTVVISNQMPKIKVIDFMKGLFQMFKLVVVADAKDNVYVNTLNDYYASGKIINLTRYVDFSSNDVERGNILNEIKFNFKEPTTILNNQFLLNTGLAYGDEEAILQDANGELLDGDSFTLELPFEQFVYERLIDLNDNTQTNIMYGGIFDSTIEPANPSPHLFYNINQNITTKPIAFINDLGVKTRLNFCNIPSHVNNFTTPQFSTVFGAEFNEWDGTLISETLYKLYYQNYIDSIFNIKRRNFRYECKNIPLRILTKIQLNDIIQIDRDFYRPDSFNVNLITRETSFNLINSFDNTLGIFNADRTQIFVDFNTQIQSVYVTNLENFDYTSSELWVTASATGNNVFFDIEENTSGIDRVATVTITNTETLREIDVIIFQSTNTVTADNTNITVDSTLITADNG